MTPFRITRRTRPLPQPVMTDLAYRSTLERPPAR